MYSLKHRAGVLPTVFMATAIAASAQTQASPPAGHHIAAANAAAKGEQRTAKTATPGKAGAGAGDTATALQFLGAYTAPQAIEATETGHTSAAPPGPGTEARLAELAGDGSDAEKAASARSVGGAASARASVAHIARMMAASKTPEQWFAIGSAALSAARASSHALAVAAPTSVWNHSLNQAAVRSAEHRAPPNSPPTAAANPAAELRKLQALAARPSSPAVLYQQALTALALSDAAFERAAVAPELAARIDGVRALAAEEAGDPAAAARLYRAGLALAPKNAALHAGLGELDREQRRYRAAHAELQTARHLNARDPVIAYELGDVEFRLGQPEAALPLLDQAVAQSSSMPSLLLVARWSRARAEVALGRDEAAVADFQAAASADPGGELQYQLSVVYRKMGRAADAAAALHLSDAQRAATRRAAARRLH
ncbi:MAG: tetratricopeptide repeat protein [Terriglobales bacterium]